MIQLAKIFYGNYGWLVKFKVLGLLYLNRALIA